MKRILTVIPVMLGVLTIVFIMNELTPGDPAEMLAGSEATTEQIEEMREELGLNRNVVVRYVDYVIGLVTEGDMGTSYSTKQPITTEILDRYPTTLKLAFLSILIAVVIGIPLGVLSAIKQNSILDNMSMSLALFGVSMPNFWLGLMMVSLFAVKLGWLPASGLNGPEYWIMPVVAISVGPIAQIARVTRSSMLDVIRQDYMRTARAKGQTEFKVIISHGLRNALIPIITTIGGQMGVQLGGAILAESVFGLPGLGSYMVSAIKSRNYPAVQGSVLYLALMCSLVNLAVDLLYAYVDPRIKASFAGKAKTKKAKELKGVA